MTNFKKYSMYMATNHSTGEVVEFIDNPEWASETGYRLAGDPEGFDTDIELIEADGWIHFFGVTKSDYPINTYIREADIDYMSKGMDWFHITEAE